MARYASALYRPMAMAMFLLTAWDIGNTSPRATIRSNCSASLISRPIHKAMKGPPSDPNNARKNNAAETDALPPSRNIRNCCCCFSWEYRAVAQGVSTPVLITKNVPA